MPTKYLQFPWQVLRTICRSPPSSTPVAIGAIRNHYILVVQDMRFPTPCRQLADQPIMQIGGQRNANCRRDCEMLWRSSERYLSPPVTFCPLLKPQLTGTLTSSAMQRHLTPETRSGASLERPRCKIQSTVAQGYLCLARPTSNPHRGQRPAFGAFYA